MPLAAATWAAPPPQPKVVFNPDGSITLPDGLVKVYYESDFLDGGKLNTLVQELNAWKSDKGKFRVMPDQHTLEIIERPEHIPLIQRVIRMMDKTERQVYVDAKIIEITYDSNFEFGVEFLFDKDPATDSADTFFRKVDGTFNPASYLDSLRPGASPFQGVNVIFKLLGDDVESDGRLVEEENARPVQQGRRQITAHPLPQGELANRLVQEFSDSQQLVEEGHLVAKELLVHLVNLLEQVERFDDGQIPPELGSLSENDADVTRVTLPVPIGNKTPNDDFTGGRCQDAGEHLDGR